MMNCLWPNELTPKFENYAKVNKRINHNKYLATSNNFTKCNTKAMFIYIHHCKNFPDPYKANKPLCILLSSLDTWHVKVWEPLRQLCSPVDWIIIQ